MTQPQDQPAREAAFFTTIRSWGLTRGDHGIVGGVIEGVGERIGLARVPARLIFVVLAILMTGLAALAYAAAWALLPDRRGNIIIQNFGRGVTNVGALLGIGLLTLIGLGNFKITFPFNWGAWPWDDGWGFGNSIALLWTVLLLGGLAWLVIFLIQRNRADGDRPAAPSSPTQPVGTGAAPASGDAPPVYAALPGEAGPGAPTWNDAPPKATFSEPTPAAPDADDPVAQANAQAAAAQAAAHQQAWQAQQRAQQEAWQAEQRARAAAARAARIPGPGAAGYLTALAWLILSGVGVWVAARNDALYVHPLVAWPVAVLIGWGVILMVVSLMGRRLGFLGFLTVIGILPVLAVGAGADELHVAWEERHSAVPAGPDPDTIVGAIEAWIQENIDPEFTMEEAEGGIVATAEPDESFGAVLSSPASAFADYSTVMLRGTCYDATDSSWGDPTQTISLTELNGDLSLDMTSEVVDLTVPEGVNLQVVADGDAWATVVWPDRDVWCEFYDGNATYVDLTGDPEAPTLTLVVHDDEFANTILIHEAPAPAPTDSEVQS